MGRFAWKISQRTHTSTCVLLCLTGAALLLVRCGGDDEGAIARSVPTPSPGVTRIIDLTLAGDADALEALVSLTPMECTHNTIDNPAPDCEADEAEGTLVDAFLIGFCPVQWIRPSAGKSLLIEAPWNGYRQGSAYSLYAIAPAESYPPRAEHTLVFAFHDQDREDPALREAFYFHVDDDGRILSSFRTCGGILNTFGDSLEPYLVR